MWLGKQSTYCTSKLYHALYNYSIIVSEWPSLLLFLDIPNLSICLTSLIYSSNLTQKKYALMPDISDVCSSKAVEMNLYYVDEPEVLRHESSTLISVCLLLQTFWFRSDLNLKVSCSRSLLTSWLLRFCPDFCLGLRWDQRFMLLWMVVLRHPAGWERSTGLM